MGRSTKFKRLTSTTTSDEESDEGGGEEQPVIVQQQTNNNNGTSRKGRKILNIKRISSIPAISSLNMDGNGKEYDSDEEKEVLLNEQLNYAKSLAEQQEQEELQNRQESLSTSNLSPILSSSTSTSTTTTTTTTTSSSLTTNNNNNNNTSNILSSSPYFNRSTTVHLNFDDDNNETTNTNNNSNNVNNTSSNNDGGDDDNNGNGNGNVEDEEGEIGQEAQNILFIQNELSRPLSFYSILKRILFLCILYLFPVSLVLVIVMALDWNHACDLPLKQWSVVQVIIQVLVICNFLFLLIKLPSREDNGQPSQAILRVQSTFKGVHRVLTCLWITWFIVGIIWTFKARAHDTCTSSSPYLFWVTYSVIVFQIVIASLGLLFCCCSCIFSLMRLGVSIEMLPNGQSQTTQQRGATDTMLRKLPIKKFKEGVLPKDDCSCAICLMEYVEDEKIRILPCKHHYHLNCIDRWLIQNKSCPFCKSDIPE